MPCGLPLFPLAKVRYDAVRNSTIVKDVKVFDVGFFFFFAHGCLLCDAAAASVVLRQGEYKQQQPSHSRQVLSPEQHQQLSF